MKTSLPFQAEEKVKMSVFATSPLAHSVANIFLIPFSKNKYKR